MKKRTRNHTHRNTKLETENKIVDKKKKTYYPGFRETDNEEDR